MIPFTKNLAKDYIGKGFVMNALVPGEIKIPGNRNIAKGLLKFQFFLVKDGIE